MDLSGKFLIAMPALSDPRFEKSVIVLCSHSPEGAMGLIVNKPFPDLGFLDLLDRLGVETGPESQEVEVRYGGPVEPGRGFVLHEADWGASLGTMRVPGGLAVTSTQEVLEALAQGRGPARALLALGYAGWGPGQLDAEVARNDWLTADLDIELIFEAEPPAMWQRALAGLKINPLLLSSTAGRA